MSEKKQPAPPKQAPPPAPKRTARPGTQHSAKRPVSADGKDYPGLLGTVMPC